MRRLAGSRLGATFALSVVLSLAAVAGIPASVQATVGDGRAGAPAPTSTSSTDTELRRVGATAGRAAAEVELPRPVRGATALRLLGDRLDEAAARNDLTEAELTELLTTDRSAWLDLDGVVFFKDERAAAPVEDPVAAQAPLDQTFALHSLRGSTRTIYLDFDGGSASGTAWHAAFPATPTTQPAWDTGGNPAVFDDAERVAIQTVWQAVAEDFAPFDIDVTTADPGPDGIHRSSGGDTTFGSHVLITPSDAAHDAICGGCGGVAYLGVFDAVNGFGDGAGGDGYGYRQPAWVFPQKLGNSPKNIAEAVSHEVGHNLGLDHDGTATSAYYGGHGTWAPIMGSGYTKAVTQWSKGAYTGATNPEDDVAIIRGVTGARADEAPTGIVGAPAVPSGTSYVTSRTDVDTFLLGTCSGPVTVAASASGSWANLDIKLSILDAAGQVVATDDPTSGLGAALSPSLGAGTYYAAVDGAGNGSWAASGYDDYGSLGAYALAAAGCDGAAPTSTALTSSVTGRTVSLQATVTPAYAGTVRFLDDATLLDTVTVANGAAALTLADVSAGSHSYTAQFVPADATRHAASTSNARVETVVATPTTTGLIATASGRFVTLTATPAPATGTGTGSLAGSVVFTDGSTVVGTVPLGAGSTVLALSDVTPGDHTYQATFVPAETASYAGSSSATRTLTVAADTTTTPPQTEPAIAPAPTPAATPPAPTATVAGSTTKVTAPTRARPGTRPVVKVTVMRGSAAAGGTVVVTVGTKSKVLTLQAGSVRLRLARVTRGKVKVTARYRGNATTSSSAARWTIRVGG